MFEVKSGAIRATDPCYGADTKCAATIFNVKNGKWRSHLAEEHAALMILHESEPNAIPASGWTPVKNEHGFGVDSGQFGFFDFETWFEEIKKENALEYMEHSFYGDICEGTNGGYYENDFGVASGTAYGDGVYPVFAMYNTDGEVVGLRVHYIVEEEDDD